MLLLVILPRYDILVPSQLRLTLPPENPASPLSHSFSLSLSLSLSLSNALIVLLPLHQVSVKEIEINETTICISLLVTDEDLRVEKLEQCELLRCHSDASLDVQDALSQV
eukprot:TRINITY_DN2864_c0_g3_i1.p1 TRINITY_DN2864_c0_g3~~TRINITY_DN2864_c0_g3_i1.p1  ORF type:complete len:110 (-),score=24.50 TRINITY_DN2864_c0_g3_i1:178-507(-)